MTSIATVAEIGICCDYAICSTNLTHFPKEDAQVVFIYLVTTLLTFFHNCARPWFSQQSRCWGMKVPLEGGCVRVCRRWGTLASSQTSLGPLP